MVKKLRKASKYKGIVSPSSKSRGLSIAPIRAHIEQRPWEDERREVGNGEEGRKKSDKEIFN